ncbi:MAG: nitroreductase [Armatimonadota bacterium]|nr:nitroreductase [Armatimonadota bacterium]MDR7401306.1 nitroreductase [Armatimonadota bacterium]MDR7437194.1 nitroreductase [Armatimonadota bacterium]MDR7473243.1 nitroreductase [Armatimonadota bacterium]MDR7507363.1 nitroreductase [Armatimonadota bacterium]
MDGVQTMSVLEAITTRRSIPQFKPDPVPRDLVARLLEAAVWVPNHRLTEPWRFYVLGETSKRRFAEIRRDFRAAQLPDPHAPEAQPALRKLVDDTLATPLIIVVTSAGHPDPELQEENHWATFAAAYAFMLAAWSQGIGSYFRTGGLRDYPPLREFLGLGPDERVIGVIYAGYPAVVPQKRRTPAAEKTVWLD